MNKILDYAEKLKKNSDLAEKIGANLEVLKGMSDFEVRLLGLYSSNQINAGNLKINGVSLSDIYKFAVRYYYENGENLLGVSVENIIEKDTKQINLSWSVLCSINLRQLNKEQWECLERIANLYKESNGEAQV